MIDTKPHELVLDTGKKREAETGLNALQQDEIYQGQVRLVADVG
jgi:hypothetical protein